MALEPLGLNRLRIGFFSAFGDDPSRLRNLLFDSLRDIRNDFRTRLQEDIAGARISSRQSHEKEQVREALRSAATMFLTWVTQNGTVPALGGQVQDSLVSQIHSAPTYRRCAPRSGAKANGPIPLTVITSDMARGASPPTRSNPQWRSPRAQAS